MSSNNLRPADCPWRLRAVRKSRGRTTTYERACGRHGGHDGPHAVPAEARQSSAGEWFNRVTGESLTQSGRRAT